MEIFPSDISLVVFVMSTFNLQKQLWPYSITDQDYIKSIILLFNDLQCVHFLLLSRTVELESIFK